jgi:hypothetical protein
MNPLSKVFLLLAVIIIAVAWPSKIVELYDKEPSCGGRRYNLITLLNDGSPYVELALSR